VSGRHSGTPARRSWLAALRRRALLRNASSLFGATTITSLLGFVFWAAAARLSGPSALGTASAAVSAMQLSGSLATLGLGTLLLGELARGVQRPWRLIGSGIAFSFAAGVAGGVIAAVALRLVSPHSLPAEGVWPFVLFAGGCAVTTVTMVLDQVLIGLAKSGTQLARNMVFAVIKLVLLPALAVTIGLGATGIYAAWLLGHLVSLVPLVVRVRRAVWRDLLRPPAALRGYGRSALAHHVTNTSSYAPVLALPIVVAARLGPESNAAFYAALLLMSSVWVITVHLATALFASAGGPPEQFHRDLVLSLRISGAVSVLAVLLVIPLAGPVLGLFGPEYAQARTGLVLLALATPAAAVKALYVAVCRAQNRLGLAAVVTLVWSVTQIAAGAAGTLWGVTGVCAGFLMVGVAQAAVLWPRVARHARLGPWGRRGEPAPERLQQQEA
jgi:O-antigen/teichoic acid export membrane protein